MKNIIFDVGGVLIGYRWKEMLMDYELTEEQAERIGMIVFSDPIWKEKWDRGLLSIEELIRHYEANYPAEDAVHIRYFIEHAELMRVDLPEVWAEVARLHEMGYHIYLLSNYSKQLFEKHTSGAGFFAHLDGALISYQVNLCKPEPEIYQELLRRYDLNAEECVFFDDTRENVEVAEKLGIKSFHVTSTENLLRELRKMPDPQ